MLTARCGARKPGQLAGRGRRARAEEFVARSGVSPSEFRAMSTARSLSSKSGRAVDEARYFFAPPFFAPPVFELLFLAPPFLAPPFLADFFPPPLGPPFLPPLLAGAVFAFFPRPEPPGSWPPPVIL